MDISIVIVALNHQETIMQAIEAVLSQTRLPNQLGLVAGDSIDSTLDFARFYEEEFDFMMTVPEPDAAKNGFSKLRLTALNEISSNRVLFISANTFLYRNSIEFLEDLKLNDREPLVLSRDIQYPSDRREKWFTNDKEGKINLRNLGFVFPSNVLWPSRLLKENRTSLSGGDWGPFSVSGWLLSIYQNPSAITLNAKSILESWCPLEGSYCLTKNLYTNYQNLVSYANTMGWPEFSIDGIQGSLKGKEIEFSTKISNRTNTENQNSSIPSVATGAILPPE